jgi:hypothetical protein
MPDYGPQVDRWMADRGVELKCTQCGHQSFGGAFDMVVLPAPSLDDAEQGMMGYAAVPLMCENCGHFELFSASLMGLTRDEGL